MKSCANFENETTRAEIKQLYANHDFDQLGQRLGSRIEFGTAGLRAAMEAGFSRMNDLTVLQASQGLAVYVKETVKDATRRGIVIGHDHRHNSARFAELTKIAFAHHGFKVYEYGDLVHTPMVPFGVDHFNASCGVMITASHNPAKDNGYKVYWENGCQIIPPHDHGIAASIDNNLTPWTWTLSDEDATMVENIDLTEQYLNTIKTRLVGTFVEGTPNGSHSHAGFGIPFVYTPMHGVGLPIMTSVCELLGVGQRMHVVEQQAKPDPDFSTVSFPNPEEKGALDLAIDCADENSCELILASDPDADRFAVAVKAHDGNWTQLTGNQVGALFAFQALSSTSGKVAVINSTVSSQLMKNLAELHGATYFDTLTGFKWIGNKAIDLEAKGYTVPFAFEEALGYMFPVVHDKDGISAAAMFLLLVKKYHIKSGQDVLNLLEIIYKKTGYFEEHNDYYIAPSPEITKQVFDFVRSNQVSKTHVGDFEVKGWRDLTIGYDSQTADHKPTLPVSASSQMITVCLEGTTPGLKCRFTARGSGTEPKLKVYIEAQAPTAQQAKTFADQVWGCLAKEWFRPQVSGLKFRY